MRDKWDKPEFAMRYIYIYIWVNHNDLTVTSLESWLIREIIPKWPKFRLVRYYNLPIYIYVYPHQKCLFNGIYVHGDVIVSKPIK